MERAPLFARWARSGRGAALVLFALLVAFAPAALGPSLSPCLRALGAFETHVCRCGMRPGRCGCPECARLDGDRRSGRAHGRLTTAPSLRERCADDAPAVATGEPTLAVLGPGVDAVVPPIVTPVLVVRTSAPPARTPDAPPTPPPRLRLA